jgi:hypothetical protein
MNHDFATDAILSRMRRNPAKDCKSIAKVSANLLWTDPEGNSYARVVTMYVPRTSDGPLTPREFKHTALQTFARKQLKKVEGELPAQARYWKLSKWKFLTRQPIPINEPET